MAKVISVRGKEKGDFPYYIAKTFASNRFTVAVVDNSYSKDLFESVHQYSKDDGNVIEKENIVYLKDVLLDQSFTDKFDYVVYYLGMNHERVSGIQFSFILPDFTQTNLKNVSLLDDDIKDESYYIFRDKVSNKVTEKNIALEYGIDKEKVLGYVPLELKDEIGYQNLNYNGRQQIASLSSDMQLAIMTSVGIITGEDLKAVKKYYRKAKRNSRF